MMSGEGYTSFRELLRKEIQPVRKKVFGPFWLELKISKTGHWDRNFPDLKTNYGKYAQIL